MEPQQVVALVLFLLVYAMSMTHWVSRTATALVAAVVIVGFLGIPTLMGTLVPEVLLVTAGLMVLSGYIKKAGIASWLVLGAAKVGRGRPKRILVLTGIITYVVGSLLGPVAAVALVIPVAVLLAVELDLSPLPFVVVLSWTSLLGGATTLTAQPGNLWLGTTLGVNGADWVVTMVPYTLCGLLATLVTGCLLFGQQLRVTNERRARILEYDEAQSLGPRPVLLKTLVILVVVIAGLIAGPWMGLAPSVVALGGAVILRLWDSPRSTEKFLGESEGGTLLFFGGLMAVVGGVTASGLLDAWVLRLPSEPLIALFTSTILGGFIDHGAAVGALTPVLKAGGGAALWPFVILGTSLGAGITVLGSQSNATALALAGQGSRKLGWRDFTRYGLVLGLVNLVLVSALRFVLVH